MVVIMALAFVVAWTPFYVCTLVSQLQMSSFLRKSNFLFIMLTIHLVGFINSCTNPLIYHLMSRHNIFHSVATSSFSCNNCCRCWKPFTLRTDRNRITATKLTHLNNEPHFARREMKLNGQFCT